MKNGVLYTYEVAIECDGAVGSITDASSPEHAAETREVAAACREDLAGCTYLSYVCTDGVLVKRNRENTGRP